jgi:hypothetical protein
VDRSVQWSDIGDLVSEQDNMKPSVCFIVIAAETDGAGMADSV